MMAISHTPTLPSVLVVDDTQPNLIALAAVLNPLGIRVVQASSGPEALERVREESFAVVLLDVQMPGMDGFEVAKRIRALDNGRELPIIFLTAIHRDEGYVRKGYAVGAADYVTKPFDVEVLRARVKAFVDLYQQREEVRRVQVALRTRERDDAIKRVVAFERITTAALETHDIDAILCELLNIFLDGSDAANSAAILLREGDELRTRAALPQGEPKEEASSCTIGEGFAGRIAKTRQPREQLDSQVPVPASGHPRRVRSSKVRFGVPLLDDGELVGVAIIGSTRAAQFTEREKRLFGAVAERATWAIAKHHKGLRIQAVLGSAPALIAIFRGQEHVGEFFNPGFESFVGRRMIPGRRASDLGLDGCLVELLDRAYQCGQTITQSELSVSFGTGRGESKTGFVNVTAQPLKGPTGTAESVLLFAVDVTTQVRARNELEAQRAERARLLERERAARNEAEIANRAKDEFLATLSHELRTPLNAVLGWTARARSKASPDLDRALAIIERNAQAQARLIDDMLDLSRIISGKLRLEIGTVLIEEPIQGAIEAVRPAAEVKDVQLEISVEHGCEVTADPDRLQQIVWNLLTNAIKFTPKGGRVSLRAHREASKLVVSVSDTGQGIPVEFLPHIFEPFRQADASTTRRHGGLGLGLAIVKQLAQAHGGTVRASSEGPGLGSVFVLELPVRVVPVVRGSSGTSLSPAGGPSAQNAPGAQARLEGVQVLVVDDEADARALVAEMLAERGALVALAESMPHALEAVQRFRPNVIVSDIGMPNADGYQLMRAVRALPSDRGGRTPAIALTAYTRSEDEERALASGFDMHLTKPVDLDQLVVLVAQFANKNVEGP